MPRTLKTLTTEWQVISTGPCTILVEKEGEGPLMINDAQDESTAWKEVAEPNIELRETALRTLYAKGAGYRLIIDPQGA